MKIRLLLFFSMFLTANQLLSGPLYDAITNNDIAQVKKIIEQPPYHLIDNQAYEQAQSQPETDAKKLVKNYIEEIEKLFENLEDYRHGLNPENKQTIDINTIQSTIQSKPYLLHQLHRVTKNRTPLHFLLSMRYLYNASLATSNIPNQLYDLLKLMLQQGANPNFKTGNVDSPIHSIPVNLDFKSKKNKNQLKKVLSLLKSNNIDLNNKNNFGGTLLHSAANAKNQEIYDILVSVGADKTIKNSDDKTARELLEAAPPKDIVPAKPQEPSLIETLFTQFLDFFSSPDPQFDQWKEEIKKDNSILNQTDKNGLTLLHWILIKNNIYTGKNKDKFYNLLNFLLEQGASPKQKTETGWTPIHSMIEIISEKNLTTEDKQQITKIVNLLKQYDADLDAKNSYGETILHLIANKYYIDRINYYELFVKLGSDQDIKDNDGRTPWSILKTKEPTYIPPKEIKQPKETPQRADLPQSLDFDSMFFQLQYPEQKVLTHIQECKNNPNYAYQLHTRDDKGKTILELAMIYGKPNIVKQFNNFGIQNKDGRTPLFYISNSSKKEIEEILSFLKQKNVNFNHQDSKGNTILHYVATNRNLNEDFLKLLLKNGVNPNIKNNNEKTPADLIDMRLIKPSGMTKSFKTTLEKTKETLNNWAASFKKPFQINIKEISPLSTVQSTLEKLNLKLYNLEKALNKITSPS